MKKERDSLYTKSGNVKKLCSIYNLENLSITDFALAINWDDPDVYQHFNFYKLFVNQYKYHINWFLLFKYQKVSEKTIIQHMDQYGDKDWLQISKHQNISIDFINENYEKLTWKEIVYRLQIGAVERLREKG